MTAVDHKPSLDSPPFQSGDKVQQTIQVSLEVIECRKHNLGWQVLVIGDAGKWWATASQLTKKED